ncbi:MAG TPA: response regulator, partial [Polyangiaceae bacterium]|nr:response regulator [Polyangiaceae bacterium]
MTRRILIVDDDADLCTLLETLVVRLGYAADVASSGPEALERIARGSAPYAAILTDLGMHGMSGFDLCQHLIAAAPGVPVIVVTADNSTEAAIHAIRNGAFDYLTKPVDANLLGLSLARASHRSGLLGELERLRNA